MTELERARAYLQKQQGRLRCTRAMRPRLPAKIVDAAMARIEADFLAALSWVWDAQERASTDIRMGIYQGGLPVTYALAPHGRG